MERKKRKSAKKERREKQVTEEGDCYILPPFGQSAVRCAPTMSCGSGNCGCEGTIEIGCGKEAQVRGGEGLHIGGRATGEGLQKGEMREFG